MATDTNRPDVQASPKVQHSAFEEFRHDERHPAVLLLSALVIAALFFGLGILFDRWTSERNSRTDRPSANSAQAPATVTVPTPANEPTPAPSPASQSSQTPAESALDSRRRFTILIASFDRREKAEDLVKELKQAGYRDARIQKAA